MSKNPPTLLNLFPVKENNAMESVSSTTTRMVEDQPVSTALTLSLFPTTVVAHRQAAKPRVDLSLWCFNFQETDQEPPVLALPNHQELTLTLLSEPPTALSLFPSARIKDNLPTKNHRDLGNFAELIDAGPSLSLSLPMKRKRQINPSHLTIKAEEGMAKKQKADKIPTGLHLEVGNHWINKRLSLSDVNVSSRLLLPKEEIRKYVLPRMDVERSRACQSRDGLRVKIWDLDTKSEHELSIKQWKTGSFLLTSNWNTEFVNRRSLQEGDSIWLSWDLENRRFLFHKFSAQS